jgi:hypothetical protein
MEHGAFVLVSAPNVTHRDISLKLAIGRLGLRAGRALGADR